MATDLFGQNNNQYAESENILQGRQLIYVFVEDEEDVPFWKNILNSCGLLDIYISPCTNQYSGNTGIHRGKQNVLQLANRVGRYFILCVDSDYDYLLNGETSDSNLIKSNEFIFQTYAYAIENYKCYAPSLEDVITQATFCYKANVFDYEGFMTQFSEIIYPLFIYSVYYHKRILLGDAPIFTISNFTAVLEQPNIDIATNGGTQLNALQIKVQEKLNELNTLHIIPAVELQNLETELQNLGLTRQNTYLFVQGHCIFDNVVLMFLNPIFRFLKRENIESFRTKANTTAESTNKINQYQGKIIEPSIALRLNQNYHTCCLFEKIRRDLSNFKSIHHP